MEDSRPTSFTPPPSSFEPRPHEPAQQAPSPEPGKRKTVCDLAIVSMCLGIFSFFVPCLGFLFATAAVICGHIAQNRIKEQEHLTGQGFSIAGLVTGYVNIVIGILLGLLLFLGIVSIPAAAISSAPTPAPSSISAPVKKLPENAESE